MVNFVFDCLVCLGSRLDAFLFVLFGLVVAFVLFVWVVLLC